MFRKIATLIALVAISPVQSASAFEVSTRLVNLTFTKYQVQQFSIAVKGNHYDIWVDGKMDETKWTATGPEVINPNKDLFEINTFAKGVFWWSDVDNQGAGTLNGVIQPLKNGTFSFPITFRTYEGYEDVTINLRVSIPDPWISLIPKDVPTQITSEETHIYEVDAPSVFELENAEVNSSDNLWARLNKIEFSDATNRIYVEVDPNYNGDGWVSIGVDHSSTPLRIPIRVSVPKFDDFGAKIDVQCGIPSFGGDTNCNIYYELQGAKAKELAAVPDLQLLIYAAYSKSGPWGNPLKKVLKLEKATDRYSLSPYQPTRDGFSLVKVTRPLYVKIVPSGTSSEVTSLLVKPQPVGSITSPNAVIVGANFTAVLSLTKSFSGTCTVAGITKKVANGKVSFSLYGPRPGDLTVSAKCMGPNWSDLYLTRKMWVRG